MRVAHPLFKEQMDSPDIANKYRANGTYEEFAKTGGVSDADKVNLRSRGNAVIPSYYAQMIADADRLNTAQGGFNPGALAMRARLGRDQAAGAQKAATDTELGIV
jgi:hypothetical protein